MASRKIDGVRFDQAVTALRDAALSPAEKAALEEVAEVLDSALQPPPGVESRGLARELLEFTMPRLSDVGVLRPTRSIMLLDGLQHQGDGLRPTDPALADGYKALRRETKRLRLLLKQHSALVRG